MFPDIYVHKYQYSIRFLSLSYTRVTPVPTYVPQIVYIPESMYHGTYVTPSIYVAQYLYSLIFMSPSMFPSILFPSIHVPW